ncbi:MAG: tyrosine-type recombinase/integrase [Anaerolineales bacterium]
MSTTHQLPLFQIISPLSTETLLQDAIEPFREYLRNEGKSDNTIKGFSSDLHLMCQFFGDNVTIGSLQTRDLNRFLDWLEHGRGRPCSQKSYARRVTTNKVFFKWLKDIHIRHDDPAQALLQRSGPAPLQPVLSPQDVHTLLDFTHSLRYKEKKADPRPDMLVRLLLDTGIKKSEAMNIQLHDIRRGELPELTIVYQNKQNVYKERRLPLAPDWFAVLDEYILAYAPDDTLFTCTARNLEYVLRYTAMGAGIEGKVSFEILRWTSAVRQYLDGADMDKLREKMGLSRVSWRETNQKIIELAKRQLAQH